MPVKLKVYTNEDDALLFWSIAEPISGCRGFAIKRRKKDSAGKTSEDFLPNRTGFEKENVAAKLEEGQEAVTKPSTDWPFQRFSWTDHDANDGDTVSYQVTPVVRNVAGKLELLAAQSSEFSTPVTLGANTSGTFQPFFNRGFVMSQFMSRYLTEHKLTLKQFKDSIGEEIDNKIRLFLSGDLRKKLLDLLQKAREEKTEIFAALFELSDKELIDATCALGAKAHIVLANGSITAKTGEPASEARKRDENADARKRLKDAGVEVGEHDRFLSPGALGHNKFLVRVDKDGNADAAWTGSTNWAPTGLCTQVNNGLLIEDREIAKIYLDQWHRLRGAKSAFPTDLVDENSKPKKAGDDAPGKVRSTVWFTRASKSVDLNALNDEVKKAKQGILFLMFMPGSAGLLGTVTTRSSEPDLYVRGVVSELPHSQGDEKSVNINLVDGKNQTPLHLDIIQPEGVQHPFANFAEEVTRKQFLANIGHAIIHSKVVVIDPFSSDPTVITGSHNFSISASAKNDENFIIIKGDHELAEAYAVNILGAYAHYRWRAFLQQTKKPFNGLKDNDKWQAPKLAAEARDLRFWGV